MIELGFIWWDCCSSAFFCFVLRSGFGVIDPFTRHMILIFWGYFLAAFVCFFWSRRNSILASILNNSYSGPACPLVEWFKIFVSPIYLHCLEKLQSFCMDANKEPPAESWLVDSLGSVSSISSPTYIYFLKGIPTIMHFVKSCFTLVARNKHNFPKYCGSLLFFLKIIFEWRVLFIRGPFVAKKLQAR